MGSIFNNGVGPDFVDRREETSGARRVVKVNIAAGASKVVPLSVVPEGTKGWPAVARRLQATHPMLYESWFAKLKEGQVATEELNHAAPNAFEHRLHC